MSPELLEKMPLWQREHHINLNQMRVVKAELVEIRAALRLPVVAAMCRWMDDWYDAATMLRNGETREQAAQIIQRARR